jgi:cation transport ATPase
VVPEALWSSAHRITDFAGIVAGFLTPCLALLGPVAQAGRLPFATVALLACLSRALGGRRDAADVHPYVAAAPVMVLWSTALYTRVHDGVDAQSLGLASTAGLAAAVQLIGMLMIDRAREGVRVARTWIEGRLDVPVRVVRGEETTTTPADAVRPGEEILLLAGDVVGADARITAGEGVVAPWVDSPLELPKKEGDAIVAGARVVSGRLRGVTTWTGADRAWLRLTVSSSHRPDVAGPLARWVRVATARGSIFAGLVVAALGIANGAAGVDVVAMAAVAAFCLAGTGAAGIVALHSARGQIAALARGIVYRDAAAFDAAGRTDIAVLCSRGTILMGAPELVALEAVSSGGASALLPERVLALAAGASTVGNHPGNVAVRDAARVRGERAESVRNATYLPGLGVTATAANGESLVVGNRSLLLQEKVSIAGAEGRVTELEAQGRSVTLVALAGRLVGLIALQDGLRPGARAAVQRLLDTRIEPVLLSGEARETCDTIGRALDVEHVRPDVLPADRGAEVKALGEGGHIVAVLGHAEPDDGALGAADVSVALAAAGGGEWAVALASDDIRDAAQALSVAHEARHKTVVAAALALGPGAIAALGIALGLLSPSLGPLMSLAGLSAAVVHARR